MNSVSPEAVEVRLAQLERSLRRSRWGMVGLLLLLVALFLAWYGVGGITQREIRVHRIYAVDDAGVVRARIGEDPAGGHRLSRVAGVTFYDATGLERGGMGTMANGSAAVALDASSTPKGTDRDRIGLMVDGKGNTMFMLLDAKAVPVVMAKGGDQGGTLQVSALTPDGKQLQVRTLGVDGDKQSTEDAD